MKQTYLTLFILIAGLQAGFGQATSKSYKKSHQVWFQYYATLKLSPSWSLKTDVSIRESFSLNELQELLGRTGVYYNIKPDVTLGAGAAYVRSRDKDLMRPELRLYQEADLKGPSVGRLVSGHRFRLEERYFRNISSEGLQPGYAFNYRIRYRFSMQVPINRDSIQAKTFYLRLFDEVMLNAGNRIVYNILNNNRLGIGIGYQINKNLHIVPTYTFQVGQQSSGNEYQRTGILWFKVFHTLDLTH